MPNMRFNAGQVVTTLRKIQVLMAQGRIARQACREAEVSEQCFYRWRKEYGGLEIEQARRFKELEREIARLRPLVADLSLEKQILCSSRVNQGACTNRLTMRRDSLERTILAGLKDRLVTPELVAEFVREFEIEMRKRAAQASQRSARARAELEKIERQIHAMVEAVKEGLFHASMTEELIRLEERRQSLQAELEQQPAQGPTIHPNLAELYRRKVGALHESLAAPSRRSEAAAILRTLVTEIRLVPTDGRLQVDLYGELAAILNLTSETAASKGGGRSILLVAGASYQQYRTLPAFDLRVL